MTRVPSYWPTDGWRVSTPESHGMRSESFDQLARDIERQMVGIRGLVVIRHGFLVHERYRQGFGADDCHELHSLSKSFLVTLFGIALKQRRIESVHQRLIAFFPELLSRAQTPHLADITLEHLLTMTSGFRWSDEACAAWQASADWVTPALQDSIDHPPGTVFSYKNHSSHLVSSVLAKATQDVPPMQYLVDHLFEPLGISRFKWEVDPKGSLNGGAGLMLCVRDIAKLGYLYLHHGCWGDAQIVDPDFIAEATREHVRGGPFESGRYGYFWWIDDFAGLPGYTACGWGGQYLVVIPALDLIVVTCSSAFVTHPEYRSIVERHVIPAIR